MMPVPLKNKRLPGTDPERPVRGRSFALAVLLHALTLAAFLYAGLRGIPPPPEANAIVQASLSRDRFQQQPSDAKHAENLDGRSLDTPIGETAPIAATLVVEPANDIVDGLASDVLKAAHQPPPPDALAELARKAELLQRVSSPEEVRRISRQVRRALGAPPPIAPREPAAGGHFDYDNCFLVDAVRLERPGEIEIRETLTDPAGRTITICNLRRDDGASGALRYERILIEPNSPPLRTASDRETFEEALARQRPFEVINRFPLLRQIYDEAVLPIMDMLAREEASAANPPNDAADVH